MNPTWTAGPSRRAACLALGAALVLCPVAASAQSSSGWNGPTAYDADPPLVTYQIEDDETDLGGTSDAGFGHGGVQHPGIYCPPSPWMPGVPGAPGVADPGAVPQPGFDPAMTAPQAGFLPPMQAFAGAPQTIAAAASNVGYIDMALPATHYRLRYDSAWNNPAPDRAEFFWPAGPEAGGPGPLLREPRMDFQDLSNYFEYAPFDAFSTFVEIPVRWVDPVVNPNAGGLGDIRAGFKYALLYTQDFVTTLQFRTSFPSGDERRGLGVGHHRLEPGLLMFYRLSDCLISESELQFSVPVGGTPGMAGTVARYGTGLSYIAHQTCDLMIAPVAEFVGWTVLDGGRTDPLWGPVSASGDTIVNAKFGVRVGFGRGAGVLGEASSVYVGYGRALTGHAWYRDILRLEYRVFF
jgi:hypothetical protein